MKYSVFLGVAILSACATPAREDEPLVQVAEAGELPTIRQMQTASLWNQAPESLFGNRRARIVGDILTVIVEIDEEAEIGNQMDRQRSNTDEFRVGALFGVPQWADGTLPGGATLDPGIDLERSKSISGGGTLRREDRVTLQVAARVTEMLPNGYLVIRGEQRVRVNEEERILRAEGVVRPEDISRSNTIRHERIADARIGYVGRGAINREVKPRLGNRLLDLIVPF